MATLTAHQSHDVDDQAQAISGFRQCYERLVRGRFHGRVWQVMMGLSFLLREASNRSVRRPFSPPPDPVALAVPLAMHSARGEHACTIPRRADSRPKVVKRALDFMREHLHEDIGVPEICAAACASRRSLQHGFEAFLHTTPQAHLRALRLNAVRRTLKAHAGPPIAALASDLGFASASHFTRHCKLMFHEPPSATLEAHGLNASGPGV